MIALLLTIFFVAVIVIALSNSRSLRIASAMLVTLFVGLAVGATFWAHNQRRNITVMTIDNLVSRINDQSHPQLERLSENYRKQSHEESPLIFHSILMFYSKLRGIESPNQVKDNQDTAPDPSP